MAPRQSHQDLVMCRAHAALHSKARIQMKSSRAHGVVVSHPLRMRKALGSIPSVSIFHAPFCWCFLVRGRFQLACAFFQFVRGRGQIVSCYGVQKLGTYSLRGLSPRPMAHKTIALTTELRELAYLRATLYSQSRTPTGRGLFDAGARRRTKAPGRSCSAQQPFGGG